MSQAIHSPSSTSHFQLGWVSIACWYICNSLWSAIYCSTFLVKDSGVFAANYRKLPTKIWWRTERAFRRDMATGRPVQSCRGAYGGVTGYGYNTCNIRKYPICPRDLAITNMLLSIHSATSPSSSKFITIAIHTRFVLDARCLHLALSCRTRTVKRHHCLAHAYPKPPVERNHDRTRILTWKQPYNTPRYSHS